jgi:hypothetical protein
MVGRLLGDLRNSDPGSPRIILTVNRPEDERYIEALAGFDHEIIRNAAPRGFGANHNAAFARTDTGPFIVLNPDIRLPTQFSFDRFVATANELGAGVVAPQVRSSSYNLEDSARHFPNLLRLFSRYALSRRECDYDIKNQPFEVDWVAGMFMAFQRDAFIRIGGFDERYFLYLEDADICRRLWRVGEQVVYDPRSTVIHDAQRASRRDPQHLAWHFKGMCRFLLSS